MMEWKNKLILIAEDEDANFFLLEEYLDTSGIRIIRANNGFEVLELLKESSPDLILMDMKMPKMSGFETVPLIREFNATIPIIAQTAFTMSGDKEKMISIGCNDFISKPIEEDSFLRKLAKYIK
jgi:CheY-like chemotaxis protein